jgi:hypothetical protein
MRALVREALLLALQSELKHRIRARRLQSRRAS